MDRAPDAPLQALLKHRSKVPLAALRDSERGHSPQLEAQPARAIGEILRSLRSLTDEQVARIVAHQRSHGVRFGEAAVALRLASGEEVLWALSQQFDYPYALRGGLEKSPELVVANHPFGEQAEAFRELRSRLMFDAEVGAPEGSHASSPALGRAFAVVSPQRGDGRSYVAANLAIAFSQLGGRTLLIDADMRFPVQHKLFERKGRLGLSSVLAGHGGPDVIQSVPSLPSLFLIAVGTEPPNPLELLQRASFGAWIQKLLGNFDHVVVDVPAAESGADWRVIAGACANALMVGRPGRSSVAHLQAMGASLNGARVRKAGFVVNEF